MFYFSLAETLGCPVGELLHRLSSKEITEWKAYFKIKDDREKEEERKRDQKNKNKDQKGKNNTFGKR